MNVKYIRLTLALVFGGLASTALLSYFAGTVLISPAPEEIPTPPGYEEISLRSENGEVKAWVLQTDDPRGTIVALHGVRANRSAMSQRMELASKLGFNSLAIDLQAHGESDGARITFGYLERLDAQAAVEYAQKHLAKPIFLIGVSLGGAAAVLADPPLDVFWLGLGGCFFRYR